MNEKKILETKVSCRSLIKGIHTTAVLIRLSEPFLKCPWKELRPTDQRIRKLMTMNNALYSSDYIDRQ